MAIKLYYFPFPGKAEVARLMLTGGNIEFEDVRIPRDEWPEFKAKTPFGQVPVLDVDGTQIAQSKAIDVYSAKLAGFYPEDPLEAAQADMVVNQIDDAQSLLSATMRLAGAEERITARQELLSGAFKEKVTALEKILEGKDFVAGKKLSHGDFVLFCFFSYLKSGILDGVPTTVLDDYPNVKRLRNSVAQVDFVEKYYANETEGVRVSFKLCA